MRVSFYSRDKLSAMPIQMLRNLDIKDAEEEALVQEILNAKLAVAPVERPINLPMDKTDFKNVEDEQAFQKKIDERVAGARPKVEVSAVSAVPEVPVEVQEQGLKAKIKKLKKVKESLK